MGPNRPRTPKVGHRFVVPGWILDGDAWQVAMAEVEYCLKPTTPREKALRDLYHPARHDGT